MNWGRKSLKYATYPTNVQMASSKAANTGPAPAPLTSYIASRMETACQASSSAYSWEEDARCRGAMVNRRCRRN